MVAPRIPALLAALLAGVLLAGCGSSPAQAPGATTATAIADLRASRMHLVRIAFCDLVPAAAVRSALGGAVTRATTWGNGDPVPGGSAADPGHEFGCSWTGPSRTTASAWVFARPVTGAFARTLVHQAARPGCRSTQGPGFGRPSLTRTCSPAAGPTRVRHAGLFGDTWLTCETSGRGPGVAARADRWCASVATSLDRGSAR